MVVTGKGTASAVPIRLRKPLPNTAMSFRIGLKAR